MPLYDKVGKERLEAIMVKFYDRLFEDVMIGFIFHPFSKEHLIKMQIAFTGRLLGASDLKYEGRGIREAHKKLSLRDGQFARRQKILYEVLVEEGLDQSLIEEWLQKENSLRSLVLNVSDKC